MMPFDVESWRIESRKHPFFGENISKERYKKVWDDAAENYDAAGVGPLRERITDRLIETIITKDRSVIDIGCGPGTYSTSFAAHSRSVTCLDGSAPMLKRIEASRIENIRCVLADWEDYETDERFDIVFSSLCPALNNPEGILKMESLSNGYCVYVSSMNDDTGSIDRQIWKSLGKDYTYNGYNTNYPYRFLLEKGRTPTLEVFEDIQPFTKPFDEVMQREIRSFSEYMDVDDRVRGLIETAVRDHSVGDDVQFEGRKRLGLLIWSVR